MRQCKHRLSLAAALWLAITLSGFVAPAAYAEAPPTSGIFHGVGVVTAIDPTTGALTIDHGAITGFMAAMEMMYRVDPATLAAGLHVGDRVGFDIDASRETIIGVHVIGLAP